MRPIRWVKLLIGQRINRCSMNMRGTVAVPAALYVLLQGERRPTLLVEEGEAHLLGAVLDDRRHGRYPRPLLLLPRLPPTLLLVRPRWSMRGAVAVGVVRVVSSVGV